MSINPHTKLAVSVTEMAKMIGLSRARFYQLVESGVFPRPERHADTGRPFYSEQQQKVVLEVRRKNCGINGQAVLFYTRRIPTKPTPAKPQRTKQKPTPKSDLHADLLAALHALGLTDVTLPQVAKAVGEIYPHGVVGEDEVEVVRTLFLRLKLGRDDQATGA